MLNNFRISLISGVTYNKFKPTNMGRFCNTIAKLLNGHLKSKRLATADKKFSQPVNHNIHGRESCPKPGRQTLALCKGKVVLREVMCL